MAKVHITLVGGQPAPVYHGIIATKPDIIVYIYSESSREVVDKLQSEISIPVDEQEPLDPTDPIVILRRAESLAQKYKDDEVTVNISSGLKSWSHLFGIVFDKQPNAEVVYMDQNNFLWNYKTMESRSDFEFDMHALFRLYGNPLENNYRDYSDYTQQDVEAVLKIEEIRHFNHKSFNNLVAVLDKKKQNELNSQKEGHFEYKDSKDSESSFVDWKKKSEDETNDVVVINLSSPNKGNKQIEIKSENAINLVFNSGWFEFKIANLLSKWDKTKEICMNCRFPYKPKVDKNEVDIIVNTGTKILFVECKTQINQPTDIDKFRTVVKGYGGIGSKGIFITQSKMTDVAREKCNENGIIPFSLSDAANWKLSPEKALFLILDSELFNINTK